LKLAKINLIKVQKVFDFFQVQDISQFYVRKKDDQDSTLFVSTKKVLNGCLIFVGLTMIVSFIGWCINYGNNRRKTFRQKTIAKRKSRGIETGDPLKTFSNRAFNGS